MTARPPTMITRRPVRLTTSGMAITMDSIEDPIRSTTRGDGLPDTFPRLRRCPGVQDLPATTGVPGEVQGHEQRMCQRPATLARGKHQRVDPLPADHRHRGDPDGCN